MGFIKKILNIFKTKYLVILLTILFSFALGYFVTTAINYFNTKYECDFETNLVINEEKIINEDNLKEVIDSDKNNKYDSIDYVSLIKNNDIYFKDNGSYYSIITKASYYETFFSKTSGTVSTRAKTYLKDLLIYSLGEENITFKDEDNIIEVTNMINPFLVGGITCGSCFLICMVLCYFINREDEKEEIYDNITVFKSPFHAAYWKGSLSFYKDIRKMTLFSMLLALLLVQKMIKIPTGFANLGLGFGFIFMSLISLIFGSVGGVVAGGISDILGFFLFDSSGTVFFFGYTIQAMVAGLIYGLCFYKTKLSYLKVLISRIAISFVCNIIIGSLCWGAVANYNFTQTIDYMLFFVLPKNLIYLIPQSIILYLIIKALSPVLSRLGYIDKNVAKNIHLI